MHPKTTRGGLVTEVIQYIAGAIILLFGFIIIRAVKPLAFAMGI